MNHPPSLDRRTLLLAAGAGLAGLALPRRATRLAFGEPGARRPTVVVVFLRGGADALNVIVPYGDARYYDIRPTISIAPEDDADGLGVVRIDKTFGFHPALLPLKPAFDAGRVAGIVCTGSPHPTRSHFDAQDFMEYAAPGVRTIRDGWLNRFLAATRAAVTSETEVFRALAMQGLLPRALRGAFPAVAVPDRGLLDDEAILDVFEDVYGATGRGAPRPAAPAAPAMGGDAMPARPDDDAVLATGKATIETLRRLRRILAGRRTDEPYQYPATAFGTQMQAISRLVRAEVGLEVACVDVPGFDHHANEGGREGALANLLRDVAGTTALFLEELGGRTDDVLVVTMSEFGRTCRENGTAGTDHGHGGFMLLAGGKVKGGRLYGDFDGLADEKLWEGRDLPVTTDFRDVLAEILRGHLRFDPPAGFFPGWKPARVKGLFGG